MYLLYVFVLLPDFIFLTFSSLLFLVSSKYKAYFIIIVLGSVFWWPIWSRIDYAAQQSKSTFASVDLGLQYCATVTGLFIIFFMEILFRFSCMKQ